MWNYFPFPADVQLTTTKVGGWATATRGRDQTNHCSPSSCWYNEVCFRSPARRLSDDRFQLTKSQSFPREKQLLSTLNRRQTFSFALVLYLADGKWTISRCKAYRRISSIFFSFFFKEFSNVMTNIIVFEHNFYVEVEQPIASVSGVTFIQGTTW